MRIPKNGLAVGTVGLVLAALPFIMAPPARADYQQRIELGFGIVTMSNPSQTSFEIGGEYEYRVDPMLGLGASGNYIFSDPSVTLLAVPDLFLHPFGTEFLVSAAPLFEFGSGTGTNVGARLGTRLPLPLGPISLVPSFAIDFINGRNDYIIGLGLEF